MNRAGRTAAAGKRRRRAHPPLPPLRWEPTLLLQQHLLLALSHTLSPASNSSPPLSATSSAIGAVHACEVIPGATPASTSSSCSRTSQQTSGAGSAGTMHRRMEMPRLLPAHTEQTSLQPLHL